MSEFDDRPTGTTINLDGTAPMPDLGRLREWRQQMQGGTPAAPEPPEPTHPFADWLAAVGVRLLRYLGGRLRYLWARLRYLWGRLCYLANMHREEALVITTPAQRRGLVPETVIVLMVSLGASAIRSILSLVNTMTQRPLSQTTVYINNSVTPDRPWLDVLNQLSTIAITVAPAVLALYLLSATRRPPTGPLRVMGITRSNIWRDLALGSIMAASVGIPGLGLYALARVLGINATVAAGNLAAHWWTIPMYVLLAAMNGILEEVVMIGYLFTRWTQRGMQPWTVIIVSAVIRGSYHLYQGFGAFIGNVIMGVIFGWIYMRTKRVLPLVIAHTLLDVISFVGYSLLVTHWAWLSGAHAIIYVATQIPH